MNCLLEYVMEDNIQINPINNEVEKVPANVRLYEQGVEKYRRREEDHKMKRMQEERELLAELQVKPTLNKVTRDIIFKRTDMGHRGDFYQYNEQWVKKIEAKVEKERELINEVKAKEIEEEKEKARENEANLNRIKRQRCLGDASERPYDPERLYKIPDRMLPKPQKEEPAPDRKSKGLDLTQLLLLRLQTTPKS
jgi:hypothetical protein